MYETCERGLRVALMGLVSEMTELVLYVCVA